MKIFHISDEEGLKEFEKEIPAFPDWLDEMPLEQFEEEWMEYRYSKNFEYDEEDLEYYLGRSDRGNLHF